LDSQFTINFSVFFVIEIIGEASQEFGRFLPLVPGDSLLSPRPSPMTTIRNVIYVMFQTWNILENKFFLTPLNTSKTKMPFYILTSNPQIIRGNMENWKITRFGHASRGKGDTRINDELQSSLSRRRITVSLQYAPSNTRELNKVSLLVENNHFQR
jgi:hypothetical protein